MTEQLYSKTEIWAPKSEREPGLTLAYLGPVGTFTHEVALGIGRREHFADARLIEAPSITDVIHMVNSGRVTYGVVPIENSSDGHITDTIKALARLDTLTIVAEEIRAIHLYTYMCPDAKLREIRSKKTVEDQASRYLKKLFPGLPFHAVDSTALAVSMAAKDPSIVGIGSEHAARWLGLESMLFRSQESIEDNPNNATTFVVIRSGKENTPITGNDKTSFMICISNTAGSLYKILDELHQKGINLNKIKSLFQSDHSIWFLISVDGHETDENLKETLSFLGEKIPLRRLGSYQKSQYSPKAPVGDPDIERAVQRIKNAQNGNKNWADQTTIVFTLPNLPGALKKAIEPFAKRKINLTTIDSQASGNVGEYIFYLAFENHTPNKEELLEELRKNCVQMINVVTL